MARTCVLGPVVPARSVYRGDEQTRAQLFSGAFFFFFFPLVLQRFFVLRGAVSCWNSFHNKLKNPAVALEAAVEAEGSCVLSRMGGGSSAAKVGSVSNTVPAGLGVGGGIRSRVAGARPSEETEGRLDSQVPRTRG